MELWKFTTLSVTRIETCKKFCYLWASVVVAQDVLKRFTALEWCSNNYDRSKSEYDLEIPQSDTADLPMAP